MKVRLLFVIVLFLLVLFARIPIVSKVIQKEEKHECLQWQQQAKEIKGFFLLKWQKEQCDYLGVKIKLMRR